MRTQNYYQIQNERPFLEKTLTDVLSKGTMTYRISHEFKKSGQSLKGFIKRISKLNVNNILIEAGPRLLGSFGDHDLIDEYIFYISPEKLGDKALHFYGGDKQLNFFDKKLFDIVEETNIGKDKKIILRKK